MVSSSSEARLIEPATGHQRNNILRVSAALFAKKGFQSVGVAEIGEAVNLGRGALYYHIGSKEQLLFDIVKKYIVELVETGKEIVRDNDDPETRIRLLSYGMLSVVADNLAELTVCFREAEALTGPRHRTVSKLHSDYQSIWTQTLADGHSKGVFRAMPPVAVKGLLGMYFHSFLWLNPKGASSSREIADVFSDIVLRAARI